MFCCGALYLNMPIVRKVVSIIHLFGSKTIQSVTLTATLSALLQIPTYNVVFKDAEVILRLKTRVTCSVDR